MLELETVTRKVRQMGGFYCGCSDARWSTSMGTSPVPTNAVVSLGLATNATPFLRTIICDSSMRTVARSGIVSSFGKPRQYPFGNCPKRWGMCEVAWMKSILVLWLSAWFSNVAVSQFADDVARRGPADYCGPKVNRTTLYRALAARR